MLYKQWIKPWINLHTKHGRLSSHGDVDSAVHRRRNCIMFTRHHHNCAKQFKQKSITVTGRPAASRRLLHRRRPPVPRRESTIDSFVPQKNGQKVVGFQPFHSNLRVKTLMVVSSILEWGELQEHCSGELTPATVITVFTGRGTLMELKWRKLAEAPTRQLERCSLEKRVALVEALRLLSVRGFITEGEYAQNISINDKDSHNFSGTFPSPQEQSGKKKWCFQWPANLQNSLAVNQWRNIITLPVVPYVGFLTLN